MTEENQTCYGYSRLRRKSPDEEVADSLSHTRGNMYIFPTNRITMPKQPKYNILDWCARPLLLYTRNATEKVRKKGSSSTCPGQAHLAAGAVTSARHTSGIPSSAERPLDEDVTWQSDRWRLSPDHRSVIRHMPGGLRFV